MHASKIIRTFVANYFNMYHDMHKHFCYYNNISLTHKILNYDNDTMTSI